MQHGLDIDRDDSYVERCGHIRATKGSVDSAFDALNSSPEVKIHAIFFTRRGENRQDNPLV